jgi:hypothetical protein
MKKIKLNNSKGSVLAFMLCIILLMGIFAHRLMEKSLDALRKAPFSKGQELEYCMEASSALEAALAALAVKQDFGLNFPGVGWPDRQSLRDWLASHDIQPLNRKFRWEIQESEINEGGKLPFFGLQAGHWKQLFAWHHSNHFDVMFDEDDGQPYFDSMMDWIDSDDDEREEGAEEDYYEQFGFFPKNKPIFSFDDFKRIKGFFYDPKNPATSGLFFDINGTATPEFRKFSSIVSFYNEGKAERNLFSAEMKDFLAGDDDRLREDMEPNRDGDLISFSSILLRIREERPGFDSILTDQKNELVRYQNIRVSSIKGAKFTITSKLKMETEQPNNNRPSNPNYPQEFKKLKRSPLMQDLGYRYRFIELDSREHFSAD